MPGLLTINTPINPTVTADHLLIPTFSSKKKWDSMSKQSKECYYQNINPGDTIDSPDEVKSEIKEGISRSFSIIDINIIKIDWLHLSSLGHTRAKFTKENNFQGEWIAP